MLLSKRLWAVLLVGVLVVGLLVGFGDGDEAVAKEPRATIGKIMIGAAAFTPTTDNFDYSTDDGTLLRMTTGAGFFTAPLSFPVPVVNIRKITLIAYDNTTGGAKEICAYLIRAHPLSAKTYTSGGVCTADSGDDPQRVAGTALTARKVYTVTQAPYLLVEIGAPSLYLYGLQVVYSY